MKKKFLTLLLALMMALAVMGRGKLLTLVLQLACRACVQIGDSFADGLR